MINKKQNPQSCQTDVSGNLFILSDALSFIEGATDEYRTYYSIDGEVKEIRDLAHNLTNVIKKLSIMEDKIITLDDIKNTWGNNYALSYLVDILNGEYNLNDAREDITGLIGSKYDPRVNNEEEDKDNE